MSQRSKMKGSIEETDIVDLILLDHKFLKECIELMKSSTRSKKEKFKASKSFLDVLQRHSVAEKKAVYLPFRFNEELHFQILESEVEHSILDNKTRLLKRRLSRLRVLNDETEAELKVLSEILENHIREEESELLPKLREEVDDASLVEIGERFMKLRKFSSEESPEFPILEEEIKQWREILENRSTETFKQIDKLVENLKH